MKYFVIFLFSLFMTFSISAQSVLGRWYGSFNIMGGSHQMWMKLEKNSDTYSMIQYNPEDSTEFGFKVDSVSFIKDSLYFKISSLNITYHGKYDREQEVIAGEFKQYKFLSNLDFYRTPQAEVKSDRPQEPLPPYDYTIQVVSFKALTDTFHLAGTLITPKNPTENYPIVIFSSGTGPQDRNEEMLGHKPFLVIADYLAKQGIGSLRFDDRGTGKSGGSFYNSNLNDFASDLEAAYLFLRKDKAYKNHPIGLLGHSEGGMHAMITAKHQKKVNFIITLAGPGDEGKKLVEDQQYLLAKYEDYSEETALWNKATFTGAIDIILANDKLTAQNLLNDFLGNQYDKAPAEATQSGGTKVNFVMGISLLLNNDFGRQMLAWKSADYLPSIKCPILSLNGSKDFQVPAESNLASIQQNWSKKSAKTSKIIELEGLNHLFQRCSSCKVEEYGTLQQTIDPIVLQTIAPWIKSIE